MSPFQFSHPTALARDGEMEVNFLSSHLKDICHNPIYCSVSERNTRIGPVLCTDRRVSTLSRQIVQKLLDKPKARSGSLDVDCCFASIQRIYKPEVGHNGYHTNKC